MDSYSLADVIRVYDCSSTCSVEFHFVDFPQFQEYCFALRRLERDLGDESREDYWRPVLRILRRYRFEVCSSPVPLNEAPCCSQTALSMLYDRVRKCALVYPGIENSITKVFEQFCGLRSLNQNPLMQKIIELATNAKRGDVALLIKDTKLLPVAQQVVDQYKELSKVVLVDTYQLRGPCCYARLLVIGSPRWYTDYEYIFSAPHANNIHVISYSWIGDKWHPKRAFLGSSKQSLNSLKEFEKALKRLLLGTKYLLYEDLLPQERLNWETLSLRGVVDCPSGDHNDQEKVDARLLLLEEDTAVFVEDSDASRLLVIDLYSQDNDWEGEEDEATSRVRRIPVRGLVEGMFIVLRTSGGGDYIIPVADRLMGERAVAVRATQKIWKSALKSEVSRRGIDYVVSRLRTAGSQKANDVNVRNWISERNIKPRDNGDFDAIMRFLGLDHEADGYWQNAEFIDKAHRKAGFTIRKLLLQQLLETDLSQLFRKGKMDFELREGEGGSLTAFRVKGISPGTYQVYTIQLNRPFEGDEEAWQR